MRLSLIGVPLVLVCFTALSIGCKQNATSELPKSESVVEPAEGTTEKETEDPAAELSLTDALQQVTDGKAVLVDVRSDKEWNESHFEQAKHISIDKINEDAVAACAGLDKGQLVLLH